MARGIEKQAEILEKNLHITEEWDITEARRRVFQQEQVVNSFGDCKEVYKTETRKYLLGLLIHRLLIIIANAVGVEWRDGSQVGVIKGTESVSVDNPFELFGCENGGEVGQ